MIVLDGGAMRTRAEACAHLRERLALPAHFGDNLDALYDALTELPPCVIVLEHTQRLYGALGPYAEKLLSVFRDAARENPNIQIQEDIKTF